jgi:arsenite methyltransferase
METAEQLKQIVKQKDGEIASQDKTDNAASCCGSSCCSTDVANIMTDDYTKVEGYNPDADLGLGCGLPTEFAKIKAGDTVIDLGSGAGNDAFIARHETGENGKVIGIDFTSAMLERARKNAAVRGFTNVEFIEGDVEKMPVADNTADVIVSNCVLNLIPNKEAVLKEIKRVLKPGGHFSISDIVLEGDLPKEIQQAAEMYAGCVSGAIQKNDYLKMIEATGFTNITVQKDKPIIVPDDILKQYLSDEQLAAFKNSGTGIRSITVYAERSEAKTCCGPECCN